MTHFFLGVYPHPGSMSWGAVESRPHEHAKFLHDLANGTPSQDHIIKINADEFMKTALDKYVMEKGSIVRVIDFSETSLERARTSKKIGPKR